MTHLYLIDESNSTESPFVRFYVCAAAVIPITGAAALSTQTLQIRRAHGFQKGDPLKWATRSRPAHVTPADHLSAKAEILAALQKSGVVFLPVLVNHRVARNRTAKEKAEWAANVAFQQAEKFLKSIDAFAVGLTDRSPVRNEPSYLRDTFQREPGDPAGKDFSLKRTVALGYTLDGASHFASGLDIALGAFCYCVNQSPNHAETAEMLLPRVTSLMWIDNKGTDKAQFHPGAIEFLPMDARTAPVRIERDELLLKLDAFSKKTRGVR